MKPPQLNINRILSQQHRLLQNKTKHVHKFPYSWGDLHSEIVAWTQMSNNVTCWKKSERQPSFLERYVLKVNEVLLVGMTFFSINHLLLVRNQEISPSSRQIHPNSSMLDPTITTQDY